MFQTLKEGMVDTRSSSDKCRRFVELYLLVSDSFSYFRENKALSQRATDICVRTLQEIIPDPSNVEQYHDYARSRRVRMKLGGVLTDIHFPFYKAGALIRGRLLRDELIKKIDVASLKYKDTLESVCQEIGRSISEDYGHHLQHKFWPISKLPQSIFQ